jgi:flavodoxin
MKSLVIYASRTGNTGTIAEAIGAELGARGPVHLLSVDQAPTSLPAETDLIVIGGPTEGHGMTEPITRFFDQLAPGALQGMAAASFDTRLRWPRWLSGSAADGIARRLGRAGAQVIAPAESFMVSRQPALEPGEVERAAAWAATLADALAAGAPAVLGHARRADSGDSGE